ncbi:MAG: nitrogenase component 1, partial [Candidatus Methanomethylophilaceae archaeon]|nr:nitrogenase component 1 [Candidatus Methanomethylophilaceae archaeon]
TDAIERAGFSEKAMAVEESLISQPFSSGYDHTVRTIIRWISPEKKETLPGTVNILGLPISSNDWESALEDLKHMLDLIGLRVLSSPGAGCSRKDIRESVAAEFNVIVSSEYCIRTAEFYEEEYGIPAICCGGGAPVGFDAIEEWIKTIASETGKNADRAEKLIRDRREQVFRRIKGSLYTNKVKCNDFIAMTDGSVLLPLIGWLYDYLGMIPASVTPDPGGDEETAVKIRSLLKSMGMEDAWRSDPALRKADFAFADGHTAEMLEMTGRCFNGIDIGYPSLARTRFLPRPIYGLSGAMYLLDEIFSKE